MGETAILDSLVSNDKEFWYGAKINLTRLFMRKLGIAEDKRHSFDDTASNLEVLFGTVESIISKRYRYLQEVTKG